MNAGASSAGFVVGRRGAFLQFYFCGGEQGGNLPPLWEWLSGGQTTDAPFAQTRAPDGAAAYRPANNIANDPIAAYLDHTENERKYIFY